MLYRFISVVLMITLIMLPLRSAQAINFNFIGAVQDAFQSIEKINRSVGSFPFGGKIDDVGSGCVIDYVVWAPCPIIPILCPYPGVAIPLPSSTSFTVNNTLPTPGEIFTFPGISQVFPNYNEGKRGALTLGLGWTPFKPVIDAINSAIGSITIPLPVGFVNGLKLECSDSDNAVVLMVGTSGVE